MENPTVKTLTVKKAEVKTIEADKTAYNAAPVIRAAAIIFSALLILFSSAAIAQEQQQPQKKKFTAADTAGAVSSDTVKPSSAKASAVKPSAVKPNQAGKDTTGELNNETSSALSDTAEVYVMHKSPLGAVLRSAVLPGWGQFYNNSYWKIPVIWGFIGYFSYVWIDINNKYRDVPASASAAEPGSRYALRPDLITPDMNFYRDQRDLFAIYIGLTYALNLLDAYVDAHLFDFSVDEDAHTGSARLSVKFHF